MDRLLLFLTAMLSSASCGILGAKEERVVGEIELSNSFALPSAPDTVLVSVDFVVSLTTIWDGCDREGEIEVRVVGNTASITPYIYRYTGGGDCNDILAFRAHDLTVRFDVVGQARVVIMSRGSDGAAVEAFELPVWVR